MAGMERLRYLAYGSNLHPRRLAERVPSAVALGSLELSGWQIAFEKRGRDGSAKCNLRAATDADRDLDPSAVAYGVVYQITADERAALDAAEDLGRGYFEHRIDTEGFGPVFLYVAAADFIDASLAPFDWYHALVIAGARHHGLPRDYIERVEQTRSVRDPDTERRSSALRILSP